MEKIWKAREENADLDFKSVLKRFKLQALGFYQMQKSVWAYPYPCEKEVQLVCEIYEVNPFVNIIITDKVHNDDNLRKYFKLP